MSSFWYSPWFYWDIYSEDLLRQKIQHINGSLCVWKYLYFTLRQCKFDWVWNYGFKIFFSHRTWKTLICYLLNLMWLVKSWVVPCIFLWRFLWFFFDLWCSKISKGCASCVNYFHSSCWVLSRFIKYEDLSFFYLRKCPTISFKKILPFTFSVLFFCNSS